MQILGSYGYAYDQHRPALHRHTAYAVRLNDGAWAVVLIEDHPLHDGSYQSTGEFKDSSRPLDGDERDIIFPILRAAPRPDMTTVPFTGMDLLRARLTVQFQAGLAARGEAQRPIRIFLNATPQPDGVWMGATTETGYQLLGTVLRGADLPDNETDLAALMTAVSGQALATAAAEHVNVPHEAINMALPGGAPYLDASNHAHQLARERADRFYSDMTQGW